MARNYRLEASEFYVERWDETVYIQEMSAQQLIKLSKGYETVGGKAKQASPLQSMADMIFACVVDEDRKKIFKTKTELNNISGVVFMQLATEVSKMNNLADADEGDSDELLKNQLGSSTST